LKRIISEKFSKALASIHQVQRGMTGLETAIILIAFVTVASVFAYAVLSAGLFSAERGKETVYAGLEQAKANLEVSGSVIVTSDNATRTAATEIRFTVRNAIAGSPIDMTPNDGETAGRNRCILSLTTAKAYFNNIPWSCEPIGDDDGDYLLESGEQLEITLVMADLGTPTTGEWADLGPNDWFNIQVKPMLGSTMTLQRTLPAGLDDIMDLH